jgi:signal transduction histidine kinase
VHDAGPGFDVDRTTLGSGLHNMQDRLDALGGELVVTSRPDTATTISGRVPVDAGVPVPAGCSTS